MTKQIKEIYKIAKKLKDTDTMIDCVNLDLRAKEVKKMKDYNKK